MKRRTYRICFDGKETNISFKNRKDAEAFIKDRESLLVALKAGPNSYAIVSTSEDFKFKN